MAMESGWGFPRSGGGAPIGNEGLVGRAYAGGGLGAYGAPADGVVNQKKPKPYKVQPSFPLVTNEPSPLSPPPKPVFDPKAPGGMSVPDVQRNWLGTPGFDPRAAGAVPDVQRGWFGGQATQAAVPDVQRNWLTPGTGWTPIQANATPYQLPELPQSHSRVRGPLLPGSGPNYREGNGFSLEPGQWHQAPGYIGESGAMWNGMEPGSQHQAAGYAQGGFGQPMGGGPPMTGMMGGMGGYAGQGGYAPGVQDFVNYMNLANQKNADRQNNVSGGYEAMKDWISQMYGGLGNQQRKDINTVFDKEKGKLTQDMIARGLTASTVLDNMQKGNERTRGEALARLDDDLTKNMVGATLPVWSKQLDFLTDVEDNGPDLGLMSQLLQQANSAGGGMGGGYGYGGGAGIPITIDSGDVGYQMPGMGMGGYSGPSWIQGGGMTVPINRALNNRLNALRSQQKRIMTGPQGPMVFGPDGGTPGMGVPAGMIDMFDPGMAYA